MFAVITSLHGNHEEHPDFLHLDELNLTITDWDFYGGCRGGRFSPPEPAEASPTEATWTDTGLAVSDDDLFEIADLYAAELEAAFFEEQRQQIMADY